MAISAYILPRLNPLTHCCKKVKISKILPYGSMVVLYTNLPF